MLRSIFLLEAVARASLVCCLAFAAACGEAEGGRAAFHIRLWTIEDGLPQNRVACLRQTRDGYLWIGTWFGLARFDGNRFTPFNQFNTPELTSAAISSLAEDSDGTLWIGTADGLVCYRNHHFQRFSVHDGLPAPQIWRVVRAKDGGVWLHAGVDFLVRFQKEKVTRSWRFPIPPACKVTSLRETRDGNVNLFLDCGWLAFSPGTGAWNTNYLGMPASPGPEGGFDFIAGGVSDAWPETTGLPPVSHIYVTRSGERWLSTKAGDLFHGFTNWTKLNWPEDLVKSSVVCMEEDQEGHLWVGTEHGLLLVQRQFARSYTTRDGLASDKVWSVCESADGTIWLATEGGLSRIREAHVQSTDSGEPPAGSRCLLPDRGTGVWLVKSDNVLVHFQNGMFFPALAKEKAPGFINALYEDRSGRLWIGGSSVVAALQNDQITIRYDDATVASPLKGAHCIHEDREGALWFGMKGRGVARRSGGKWSSFTETDGLSNNDVWEIHEDSDGTLWFGTENGLTRCRNGRCFAFKRQHGLSEGPVYRILEDDSGHFWVSGLKGIYRIRRAELEAVAEGRARELRCALFGTADGMASSECNGERQPAGWKARDGRLWFPTARGVVVIDPASVPAEFPPPLVVLERIWADEEAVYGDGCKPGILPASSADIPARNSEPAAGSPRARQARAPALRLRAGSAHVVEFQFTANTFIDPAKTRFRYRLIGVDRDWRERMGERTARYINLKPGNYRFEVTAASHRGIWNPTPANIEFSLAPYYWQTWTFYVLSAGATVGLAVAFHAYRLRWQRRVLRLEHQRALADERARIARDLHDDLGTALTGLALELDVIRREAQSGPLPERLGETANRTRALAEQMREVVWTVNPQCDNVCSFASFLEQQVSQFLRPAGVEVRLEFPEDIPPLPLGAEARHQLALAVREASTNIVRHAQATRVVLSLEITNRLIVQIKDNGRGFHLIYQSGHGLDNMRTRLEQIGGDFECVSAPGAGTAVTLRLLLNRTNIV